MQNVNRVVLTGNLTRDPELHDRGGTSVCKLRVACNGRTKNRSTGEWEDKPNYFDVVAFGTQAENINKFLAKGRGVAVDGRLDWQEWTTQGGDKRQGVQIIAESIQFLQDGKDDGERSAPTSSAPAVTGQQSDDDIPF